MDAAGPRAGRGRSRGGNAAAVGVGPLTEGPAPTRYTQVPRSTLWLLREGELTVGGRGGDTEPGFPAEVPPLYVGKSVVTNEQYEAFDAAHARCEASPDDDTPAVNVSWREAAAYCAWYSRLSGKAFRLPSEVEWEHACRGGGTGRWPWGDDPAAGARCAWTAETAGGRAPVIESLAANGVGLHDTIGLVWEWTSSLHLPYPAAPGDGRDDLERPGPRVLRGGSFRTPLGETGCSVRRAADPDARFDDVGFRIVRRA